MFLAEFDFKSTPLEFYKAPNGEPVVTAASIIRALKGNSNNAAAIVKANVRPKWLIELPTPRGGRPMLCLFEPGAYQLAGNPMFQTELAEEFQDWLFEDVLPKLRASAGYIMPTATSDQLEALQGEISYLKAKRLSLYSPHGGYSLSSWWTLLMSHRVVYLKDANGSRTYWQSLRRRVLSIDAKDPDKIVVSHSGRHTNGDNHVDSFLLNSDTWISICKEVGMDKISAFKEFEKLFS